MASSSKGTFVDEQNSMLAPDRSLDVPNGLSPNIEEFVRFVLETNTHLEPCHMPAVVRYAETNFLYKEMTDKLIANPNNLLQESQVGITRSSGEFVARTKLQNQLEAAERALCISVPNRAVHVKKVDQTHPGNTTRKQKFKHGFKIVA